MRTIKNTEKKTVTIRLPVNLMEQVDSISKQKGWGRSSTIVWICQKYIQETKGTK